MKVYLNLDALCYRVGSLFLFCCICLIGSYYSTSRDIVSSVMLNLTYMALLLVYPLVRTPSAYYVTIKRLRKEL